MGNLFSTTALALSKSASNGLTFVTGYRYAEGLLKTVNNMTFFYDANWDSNILNYRTLPIAFFHLKGIHEIMESEVQTKKMVFFNSQSYQNVDSTTGSLINVVADNIVNKPKSYKLDVIVPYDDLTTIFNSTYSAYTTNHLMSKLNANDNSITNGLSYFVKTVSPYVSVIKELINSLVSISTTNLESFVSDLTSQPFYNKNSLEAMWRNRTILKMKEWNGWKFKYVVITNIDITKESTEEGVEEASITVTELPVMTVRNTTSSVIYKRYSWLESYLALAGAGIKTITKKIVAGVTNSSSATESTIESLDKD